MKNIFPTSSTGVLTARDQFTISTSADEIWSRLADFIKIDSESARVKYKLGKDSRDWRVSWAQADIVKTGLTKERLGPISYRPFDQRTTFYTGNSRGFFTNPRFEVMSHLRQGGLSLVSVRQSATTDWRHALVANGFVDDCFVSNKTKERGYSFPLYLYSDKAAANQSGDLFGSSLTAANAKTENVAEQFRIWLDDHYGIHHTPEALLGYIYAILYAPTYRRNYADFLRSDFPRIPFADDNADFLVLSSLGTALVEAHLLKVVPTRGLGALVGKGDAKVESIEWREIDGSIPINGTQHFEKVPKPVWDFTIGGYQVIRHYLKARKGRVLSLDEMTNVENVVNVLAFTIDQMTAIDAAYVAAFPEQPGSGA